MTATTHAAPPPGELFGHPRGLYVLFATETWERFSFYGMRALLVLYLTRHFLFSDQEAGHIYGAYLGMVYALPVIGGIVADRWLGYRKAVVLGGVLLSLGHLGMAVEGDPAVVVAGAVQRDPAVEQIFYLSLAFTPGSIRASALAPHSSTEDRCAASQRPRASTVTPDAASA